MWRYFRDDMFNRFNSTPACDRRTDRQNRSIYCDGIVSRSQNEGKVNVNTGAWKTAKKQRGTPARK